MNRRHLLFASAGWLAFFYLAFCSAPGLRTDGGAAGDGGGLADQAVAADSGGEEGGTEPVGGGTLHVVDDAGQVVGVLVSRTHRLLDQNELYDAVTVYHPKSDVFFSIRMTNAQVLLPAKVLFVAGDCTGTAAVRAACIQCRSGYDLAFAWNGIWYRVKGGEERSQFAYSSYVADDLEAKCAGHGNSNTYAYPATPMAAGTTPGAFVAPLRFVWGK